MWLPSLTSSAAVARTAVVAVAARSSAMLSGPARPAPSAAMARSLSLSAASSAMLLSQRGAGRLPAMPLAVAATSSPLHQQQSRSLTTGRRIRKLAIKRNKVILLQDISDVGKRGQVIAVRPGFGRNNLVMYGKAQPLHIFRQETEALYGREVYDRFAELSKRLEPKKESATDELAHLDDVQFDLSWEGITFWMAEDSPATTARLTFGVSAEDVIDQVRQHHNVSLARSSLPADFPPIKTPGTHFVTLRLTDESITFLTVTIDTRSRAEMRDLLNSAEAEAEEDEPEENGEVEPTPKAEGDDFFQSLFSTPSDSALPR
ncbi:hypothetical protein CAOG_00486 [Capsaspora owczarzaki ATCC 30864]|uniref:Ribosomal protein L9 domain-containing protein n=1 Tax=Capsaspora owczarzaki (strain ATCC 30864) TaxID=595528 RepID=A0A0D2WIL3_CAPO3|nr:hypothetical protein CAOG_00486 [Capsaspora owczarzaki ATCC 30864]KJE88913.1 hypothetical protein CAOG_000486 [Capsaspora owczarzaki ATCC 30864]|eukprot:XP_004365357.2 hypothetical protein CAOG_00486 [Capsaspora owczarzaki ATCC 30864]